MVVPFTAGSTLPALQYFDQLVDNKTGVSKMAQGLDPDVLKSATATSVAASVEGQAGQAEVIARNLAEGGMRRLFSIILDLAIKNIDAEEVVRLNNQFVPVQPAAFDPEMDLIVNVGIGTGREQERAAAIMQAFTIQQQIYTTYGPMNGVVTLTQMRNAMADLLALGGIRNIDRYFQPMNEEMEQQMLMQQQQQQQMMMQQQAQQADPNQMFMQAEAMKAQTKAQVDMAKAQMDQQYKYAKLMADDDLERDGMIQDLAVKVAEILGKYGTSVDVETIKREQAADTALQQQIMGAMVEIEIRAARSGALLNNEHFIDTMKDLRERQKDIFVNSAASDVEGREEAHAIIRALDAIEVSLRADVDAVTILKKRKEQHRGND